MKRITPEEVKAAYERAGAKPTRLRIRHLSNDEDKKCCGLGAITLACCAEPPDDPYGFVYDAYGEEYCCGFTTGFDGEVLDDEWANSNGRYVQGFEDGQAAAALVFADQ